MDKSRETADGIQYGIDMIRSELIYKDERIRELFYDALLYNSLRMLNATERKSPIESILNITMDSHAIKKIKTYIQNTTRENFSVNVVPQYRFGEYHPDSGRRFVLDFMIGIDLGCKAKEYNEYGLKFCIECDGHNFHEKTKEQVARDKERDRVLTHYNYTVIRFSGSEIYNDPWYCADVVAEIVIQKINEKLQGR